ncbi:MAG: hypothetical protein A2V90_00860 [Gammaproteobacteria bacterium RBG_16_57_12]|nr:MAG: hypothetical protein A2V90_00860 [Gammaproteobacteria bacterium RBG_16_57_12]
MSDAPGWLPPLVLFSDYGGKWDAYLDAIYEWFKQDFIDSKPVFQGRRLGLKRHPMTHGKEATFWHMIQEGDIEEDRAPDFRRCERICWPRPVIEHNDDSAIKIWRNQRGNEVRVCLWFAQENYLVILADRGDYILPWTAYLVEQPHRQRKLQREYEEYCRTKGQKG